MARTDRDRTRSERDRTRSRPRRFVIDQRADRGVTAVELAIVLPLLVMLVFGIIDFGIVLNDYQSIRAGTRDGARNAIVAETDVVPGCGAYASSSTALICGVKELTQLASTETRVRVLVDGDGAVGGRVTVCTAKPMTSVSGIYAPMMSGSVLKSKVTMRIEVEADPPLTFASDQAVTGDDWAWCTP